MIKDVTASLHELDAVAAYLAATLPSHAVIFLRGDLAAGKTTLVQAIARSRGIEGAATSPTFSLQHAYGEGLYHYDLYRISQEAFMQMGLFEELEHPGWHLVEWGGAALETLIAATGLTWCVVEITPEDTRRHYHIQLSE